jgi:hypothetical protein
MRKSIRLRFLLQRLELWIFTCQHLLSSSFSQERWKNIILNDSLEWKTPICRLGHREKSKHVQEGLWEKSSFSQERKISPRGFVVLPLDRILKKHQSFNQAIRPIETSEWRIVHYHHFCHLSQITNHWPERVLRARLYRVWACSKQLVVKSLPHILSGHQNLRDCIGNLKSTSYSIIGKKNKVWASRDRECMCTHNPVWVIF